MGRSLDQLTKEKSSSPQNRCLLSAQARCTEVQGKLCAFPLLAFAAFCLIHLCHCCRPAAAVSRHSLTPEPIFFILPTWIRLEQRQKLMWPELVSLWETDLGARPFIFQAEILYSIAHHLVESLCRHTTQISVSPERNVAASNTARVSTETTIHNAKTEKQKW